MDRDCGYHTRFLRNESHVDVEVSERKMRHDIDSACWVILHAFLSTVDVLQN